MEPERTEITYRELLEERRKVAGSFTVRTGGGERLKGLWPYAEAAAIRDQLGNGAQVISPWTGAPAWDPAAGLAVVGAPMTTQG